MNPLRLRRSASLALALGLALAACGGTPAANTGDPAGTVSSAFAAAQSGGLARLPEFACAASKGDITSAFGGANLGALSAAGVKPEDIMGAMTVSFENVTTREVSKTDKTAVVHATGDMKINIDKEKFKAVAKTMFAAQGLPADDATIDRLIGAMAGQLGTTQKIDDDFNVVKEGNKWLLCE